MKIKAFVLAAILPLVLTTGYSMMNPPRRFTKLAFEDDHSFYVIPPDYSPVPQSVPAFTSVELECIEPGVEAPVWTKDGTVIKVDGSRVIVSGRKLQIAYFYLYDEGAYAVKGLQGSPALLKVEHAQNAGELLNSSARGRIQSGSGTMIHGFVLSGSLTRSVLIRAVGPTLKTFGVSDALVKPRLMVYNSRGGVIADSSSLAMGVSKADIDKVSAQVGAFPIPEGTSDVALLRELAPGPYTAVVLSADGGAGDVLVETYLLPLSP
jgi:hypothetical protein